MARKARKMSRKSTKSYYVKKGARKSRTEKNTAPKSMWVARMKELGIK